MAGVTGRFRHLVSHMVDVGIQSTRICQCSTGYLSLTVGKAKKGVEGARTIFMENCGLVLLPGKFHSCPLVINTLKHGAY